MSDILSICIPLGDRYPSINHLGKDGYRGGRKSDEYKKLFADVEAAARAEVERTGWAIATSECALTVVRYLPDRRRVDASNLAKTECDALTKAGVWTDDRLASPCTLVVRHDPAGEHRLAIVVVKLLAHDTQMMMVKHRLHRLTPARTQIRPTQEGWHHPYAACYP